MVAAIEAAASASPARINLFIVFSIPIMTPPARQDPDRVAKAGSMGKTMVHHRGALTVRQACESKVRTPAGWRIQDARGIIGASPEEKTSTTRKETAR
jgi:hypothetical protein